MNETLFVKKYTEREQRKTMDRGEVVKGFLLF